MGINISVLFSTKKAGNIHVLVLLRELDEPLEGVPHSYTVNENVLKIALGC